MRKLRRFLFALLVATLCVGTHQALYHPDTPLPGEWNPAATFEVAHALSPLTDFKIAGVMADLGRCETVLEGDAVLTSLDTLVESDTCGIAQRVRLASIGGVDFRPFETTCEVALRMALWERHGLSPAAEEEFGQGIREIRHYSSYNCRRIRTTAGESTRWSTHARARAVDVSGFVLEDGELIDLRQHWNDDGPKGRFLRRAQETACDVFGLVLGPDYNALHADHFHIQLDWNGCR